MKNIVIHCGMPKTGSSALQVQLAQARSNLLAHGYDYLPSGDFQQAEQGRITSGNGAELARSYLPEGHPASLIKRREELTEQFRDHIAQSPAQTVILSSEFFSAAPRPLLGELVENLSDLGAVRLVFFVREQLNALASTYIQQVKRHMLTQYPDEYFADWDDSRSPMMNYNAYFTRLRNMAPKAEILVRPYEETRLHDRGLVGLFFDLIGAEIPDADLPVDRRVNLSPNAQEIRLMIEVNKHNPRMQFSDMLVEGSHAAGRSTIHAQHSIVPEEVARKIRDSFAKSNERFFQTFVGTENTYTNSWSAEDFIDLRQVSFSATDVIDILAGLLANMDRRLARLEAQG
ncbi:hypothetical protein PXK30_21070 [Phaeobacter gallaeciensis]|uniref:hypothetical protein n=1 Tax=Phaeobacter gallaeciensis TaxID=60890 RepID=UPI00237F1678|nr:hypothetical protein [Phaeobacter gallaeciensis]MDE4306140.1 hypothetical protein [Phaeobacter gallaeciensis]MDE4310562.1 hypothetical protein [Phaeobacter gallaeciensis]MDE4315022.1 hypothetical protein [Phaeobacter gallaeciensis]MDE4319501.1 hypothetical protein [Phaeobacter gallaeciensis]MDE4323881.1 hypothetical protein [Phaeobacter gallaeciensis]